MALLLGKPLSAREREVLRVSLEGWGRKQTAEKLGLSPNTVSTHMTRAQRKLGARNPFHTLVIFFKQEAAIESEYFSWEKSLGGRGK